MRRVGSPSHMGETQAAVSDLRPTDNTNSLSNWIKWKWKEWDEWGFRPPLWSCSLNWARITSWGWLDEWDATALQTQNSKFGPWRSEVEHATSWSQRFPTILNLYKWVWKKHFVSLKLECQSGVRTCDLRFFQAGIFNPCTRAPPSKLFIKMYGKRFIVEQIFVTCEQIS